MNGDLRKETPLNCTWSNASGMAVPVVAPTAVPTIMKIKTSGASRRSSSPRPMKSSVKHIQPKLKRTYSVSISLLFDI